MTCDLKGVDAKNGGVVGLALVVEEVEAVLSSLLYITRTVENILYKWRGGGVNGTV